MSYVPQQVDGSMSYVTQQPNVIISQPGNTTFYAVNAVNGSAPGVTVITQQSSQAIPKAGEGRNWNHSLCGCGNDCGACFLGTFCTPCQLCCILNSLGELTCCACISPFTSGMLARTKIRTALGINGSFCGDICCSTLCLQCVSCQMYLELRDQGQLSESCCYCGCDAQKQCYCA